MGEREKQLFKDRYERVDLPPRRSCRFSGYLSLQNLPGSLAERKDKGTQFHGCGDAGTRIGITRVVGNGLYRVAVSLAGITVCENY